MKKLLITFLALSTIGLLSFQYVRNQETIIEEIIGKLKSFYKKFPIEKVYLHTDKPYYVAGETLWFKAYLQNSQSDTSDLSKVLYVELISPHRAVHKRMQLYINQLSTFGEIDLIDTLSEGTYRLRAYTSHLRNWGAEYFFDKPIQIYNPKNKQNHVTKSVNENQKEIDIQFFPEGGELVYGLRSTVGFKALNAQGLGVAVEGEIYDSEGVKAATFKSNQLGMGSFKLVPSLNRVYQAKIKLPNGKEASYYLPNIKQNGFVMSLENLSENRLRLRVYANHNGLEGKSKHFFILAQQNGEVFFSIKDTTNKTALMSELSKFALPMGITQFTLFDGNGIPQAERLVFVNHQDFLRISIGKDKETYKPREKINLSIFIADNEGQGAETDFSIAITDAEKLSPPNHEDHLLSNLLLSSELKGNIEQPSFYFQNTPEAEKALDDLLLTQGWRRFKWEELKNNNLANLIYPIEKGISIIGIAKGSFGAPFKNANVSALNAKNNIALTTKTNDNGQFEIQELNFVGNEEFAIQVENDKKLKAEKIAIINRPYHEINEKVFFPTNTNYPTSFIAQSQKSLQSIAFNKNTKDPQLLESVTVSSTAIKGTDSDYQGMKPYGKADATISGENLVINSKGYSNVLQALTGQAAGVQVGKDPNGNSGVLIRGGVNSFRGTSTALLLFDGIPVDFNFFNSVSPEDIDHIDIIKSEKASVYGTRGANGVVAVFPKRQYKSVDKKIGLINERVIGYHLPKEFYSPNYETIKKEERNMTDLRTTLYWNPQVITDVNGVVNLSFFANDVPAKYRVIIEGRSWRNKLGRKEIILDVQK
ncbi:MAG: TonB-dependent receptor plug domain-containing protein [Thermoflexibacter sp.]|nr:TonB-dependent receptor plug domain-containing protein [Thermoflexibacter sp.]